MGVTKAGPSGLGYLLVGEVWGKSKISQGVGNTVGNGFLGNKKGNQKIAESLSLTSGSRRASNRISNILLSFNK